DVLVLERFFTLLEGPKARLRRTPAAALAIPGPLPSGVVAEWARPWSVDNMEALDVRRAADGSAWLYVMSDDNRNPLQRTLLMVLRLRPLSGTKGARRRGGRPKLCLCGSADQAACLAASAFLILRFSTRASSERRESLVFS